MTETAEISGTTRDGRQVSLRFAEAEHRQRIARTRQLLRDRGQAALLIFAQESHYYLTGFDTAGYVFFQVGIVTADDGPLILLTRTPDRQQAEVASLYDDIRIWLNAEDATPAHDLRAILADLNLAGERIGVEFDTYGLTAANGRLVEAALAGFVTLEDASNLVRNQRLVKSAAELDHMRVAGNLADAAVEAAISITRTGIYESALSAACLTAMLQGGGDVPSGGPLVNSGERALFGRGIGGPRRIEKTDQVLVELAASYCRYHVCIEHTLILGTPDPRQERMLDIAADALAQVKEAARAGTELGQLDDIHRRVLDRAGFAKARYAACGYALGCTFRPTWMDVPPMIYSGNPLMMAPGMVFFVHIMIPDTETGLTAGVGQTFAIRETGPPEVFSALPVDLYRC
ncbi:aminopeptidase P family protein [Rhodophyticola sp. CCM32]|uniref:M24 family metallopeptidase n=1 Tax=Rhodophyticola sp. CCM32 TaxID=2916397 RepID=UPI00107F24D0|nr:Xaa-Pro peptidase family protein [Rhodophyticola sp. CCM32]QBY01352.1 aminopeptidase P family protein [Rhodophyticola sp. CCM32]